MTDVLPGMWSPPAAPAAGPTVNDLVVAAIDGDRTDRPEAALIAAAVAAALVVHADGGWVATTTVTDAIEARRLDQRDAADALVGNARTYVGHCFREMPNVCRHSVDGHYFIHRAEQCSPECTARNSRPDEHSAAEDVCTEHFLRYKITAGCSACADEL